MISPAVANQYISHVAKFFSDNLFINKRTDLRSDRSRDMIKGFARLHSSALVPLRLRCKIPITFPILVMIIQYINNFYCLLSQLAVRLTLCAAFALGYALSLRPQEYLPVQIDVPLWRQANSSLAYFWFPGFTEPFNVCFPCRYPPAAVLSDFTVFIDFNKNYQQGDSGPRSMSRAPPGTPFCCLQLLFDFLVLYPPLPESALLSGASTLFDFSIDLIRDVLHATATLLGLDPSRLVPHSLRSAALAQMLATANFSDLDCQIQGRWSSNTGLRPYARPSLSHSRRITPALYVEVIPLQWSQLMYARQAL